MYIHICIYIYICIHIYIYIYKHIRIFMYVYILSGKRVCELGIFTHVHIYKYICICVHIYTCIYMYTYIYKYTCMCTREGTPHPPSVYVVYRDMHTVWCIATCINTHVYVYTCTHVYICKYIYIYIVWGHTTSSVCVCGV